MNACNVRVVFLVCPSVCPPVRVSRLSRLSCLSCGSCWFGRSCLSCLSCLSCRSRVSVRRVYQSVSLSVCLSVCPPLRLSPSPSLRLSIYPSVHPSIQVSVHLSVHLSSHPSIHSSIHRQICLIYLSFRFPFLSHAVHLASLSANLSIPSIGQDIRWLEACFPNLQLSYQNLKPCGGPPGPSFPLAVNMTDSPGAGELLHLRGREVDCFNNVPMPGQADCIVGPP